ncbi:MAG TPA: DUF507 family protein [Candidatus Binatia bacterium]
MKPEQLERFAVLLLKNYHDKDVIVPKADGAALKKAIVEIITQNFAEEDAIEEEARKMLATHIHGSRDVDPYKMFLLAKQKLAAKRGFVL